MTSNIKHPSNNIYRLTNKICKLCAILSFSHLPILAFFGSVRLSFFMIVPVMVAYVCFWILNFYGKTVIARVGIIVTANVTLGSFSLILGEAAGIHVGFFFMPLICWVLFYYGGRKNLTILLSSLSIVTYTSVLIFYEIIPRSYFNSHIANRFISLSVSYSSLVIITLTAMFLIKQLKDANDELKKSYKELKESNFQLKESKRREHEAHDQALFGKVIRGIGHEIKNPLAGLKLWSDMLSKSLDNPEIVKKASQVFENNINRLTQRTAIMLKYTGNQKYSLQVFNLNTLLNDLVLLFEHNFKQYDINFEFKDIPQIEVYGSEDLLHSALRNVMLNALQFTPKEGTITLSAKYSNYRDPDETVRHGVGIAISDTGSGIPQDQFTEIFKPFITSHAQSENAGLGLAEVKKAMAYMYGGIDVVSEVGKGTTFYLYVPLEEPVYNGKPLIKPISEDKK